MDHHLSPNTNANATASATSDFSPPMLSIQGMDSLRSLAPTPTLGERAVLLDEHGDHQRVGPSNYGARPELESQSTKEIQTWRKRLNYYVPFTAWLPNYSLSFLGGDFLAGLTVACMLVPQSVSYATALAHLSPTAGLFAASFPGIIYALLGSSRQLNVAPEAAISLLIGQAVSDIMNQKPSIPFEEVGIAVATAITAQVGIISFLLGFFRLGFIDVILSRALLRGFVAGVGVVITMQVEQLVPMLGLVPLEEQNEPMTTIDRLGFLILNVPNAHITTTAIAFGAFGALILLRFFKNLVKARWVPEVLVVVIVFIMLSAKFDWDDVGVDILGSVAINTGSSFFKFPVSSLNWPYFKKTTSTAVLTAIIGFLDSIVAAKQNAARFQYSISPNRELVALGAANLTSSFIPGTLPAYGSITRSRINADVGGRTQMASLICSSLILIATFYLLPWMYHLPKCVLASIVALVIINLLAETPHDLIYYWRMSAWVDMSLMLLTFFGTIIWSVEVGVLVSLVISLLLVVHRSSKTRLMILGRIPGTDRWRPISEDPEAKEDTSGIVIIRIRENLDFANTAQLKERLRRLELYGHVRSHPSDAPRRPQATTLVFHMADVETTDASAVQIFYELLETYKNRGVGVFITHLHHTPYMMFEKGGIVKLIGHDAFHRSIADAVAQVTR